MAQLDAVFQSALGTDGFHHAIRAAFGNLDKGLGILDTDRANRGFVDIARTAEQRQKPARLGTVIAPDREREPSAWAKGLMLTRRRWCIGIQKLFWRGTARLIEPQIGGRNHLGRLLFQQLRGKYRFGLGDGFFPDGIIDQTLFIKFADIISRRRCGPFRIDLCPFEQPLSFFDHFGRHDQRGYTFAPCPPCAARAVQQAFGIGGQIGMDNQSEVRKVNAARRDIGRHTDPRTTITHGLQRIGPLTLAQLARQAHDREAAIGQPCHQMVHRRPRIGKDQRALGIMIAQQVENSVLAVLLRDPHGLVFDIAMLLGATDGIDTLGVILELLRHLGDDRRNRGRKQQGAAVFRGFAQHEFKVFAKAQIKHFIRFIQHDRAQTCHIK